MLISLEGQERGFSHDRILGNRILAICSRKHLKYINYAGAFLSKLHQINRLSFIIKADNEYKVLLRVYLSVQLCFK